MARKLRKGVTNNHFISQRVRVLWIYPVIGSDEHKVEHPVFIFLQLIIGYDDGRMRLESTIRKEETNLDNVSLVVFHT